MRVNRYKQWAKYHFKGATRKYKKYIDDWKEYNAPNNRPPRESTVGYLDPTFKWQRKALVDGKNRVFFHKDEWLHVISVKTQ